MTEWYSELDPDDTRPLYQQIAGQVRAAILTQKFKPGDRLPSATELGSIFGVTHMTIRNSIRQLRDEGLVYSRHGSGVFVRERPGAPKYVHEPERPKAQADTVARMMGVYLSLIREMIDEAPTPEIKNWLRENYLDKGVYDE